MSIANHADQFLERKPTPQEAFELALYLAVTLDDDGDSKIATILGAYLETYITKEESEEAKENMQRIFSGEQYAAAPGTTIDAGGPLRIVRLKGDSDLPGDWGVVGEGHFVPCKDEEDAKRFMDLYNSRLIRKKDETLSRDVFTPNWEEKQA